MTDRPRKSLRQFAAEADGGQPMQIAGKPAEKCPYCGAGMFVDGVNRTDKEIVRYVQCRNRNCRKRFLSHQPPAKILREVGGDDDSAGGRADLTIHKEAV